jgi:ribosomal protein S12 methylthiotransferase
MTLQQKIAREIATEKVGHELKLLVDQPLIARTEADAPEVDTRVIPGEGRRPSANSLGARSAGRGGYDLLA